MVTVAAGTLRCE